MAEAPIRVLVAGCSYAGIALVVNLLDLCLGKSARGAPNKVPHQAALKGIPVDIHIVDERDGYVHLIGCPLAFATKEYGTKMWRTFGDIPALQHSNVRWSQGSVTKVDPESMLATVKDHKTGRPQDHPYDYFIAATGLRRNYPVVPQNLTKELMLEETGDHVDLVKAAKEGIVVIGGGACGIEMAAELKVVEPTAKVTLIQSRDKLLSAEPLPDEFKDASLKALRDIGVEVVLGRGRVTNISTIAASDGSSVQKLTLKDGTELRASHVINAVSTQIPTTSYLPSSVLESDGLVKINNLLRIKDLEACERHYAIGDIVSWSGIKRCGAAMHMGFLAAESIHQQMLYEREKVEPNFSVWPEVPPMIALAIGKKAATYSPDSGVVCDEQQMKIFFDDDLGFAGCWNHLKLSEPPNSAGINLYSILPQTAPYKDTIEKQQAVAA